LIAEIESVARKQGIQKILIWIDPKATRAISFYKKEGCREIDPAAHYGDEAIDARIIEAREGAFCLVERVVRWL